MVAFALPLGERFLRTGNPGAVVVRGGFLLFSTVLNFAALGFLPLTTTAAIFFSSPLWICLLSIPLLGEEVGPRRWAAMFVGFLGVLVVDAALVGEVHWAVVALDRRRALRRALLDHDPQPRRARQHDDAAVLCRAGRDASGWRRSPSPAGVWPLGRRAGSPSSPSASSAGARTRS